MNNDDSKNKRNAEGPDNKSEPPLSHDYSFRQFARTKRAEGGIKAQTKRGALTQTWWGRRWIEVLESFDIGARLQRGRSYARKGQVLTIDVDKGEVSAKVQGSRSEPYKVTIKIVVLTSDQWQLIVDKFASMALYSAKLLSRQMPQQLEDVFADAGLSLFPSRESDLKTNCSCPDWSNPCKHIAAVYYLLGEEFDRDPFLIFKLRGLSEDELMASLDEALKKESARPADNGKTKAKKTGQAKSQIPQHKAEPELVILRAAAAAPRAQGDFWRCGNLPKDITGPLRSPDRAALMARNLGNFPFWRGQEDFWSSLESLYREASGHALKRLTEGDSGSR